jgi:hypothetical protein
MPTVRGRSDVDRFFAAVPERVITRLLVGAARVAANIIADEAKARSISEEVSDAIKVTVKRDGARIMARVQVKGKGAYIAPWLEYGTAPHFISVDASQREGRSVARINTLHAAGSLVIGGQFVGDTVHHPGARPHPFLRVSLDLKERDAIAAAQIYINTRSAGLMRAGAIAGGGAEE